MLTQLLLILIGTMSLAMSIIGFQCFNAQGKDKTKMRWNYSVAMIVISSLFILGPIVALAIYSKEKTQ